MRTTIIGLTLTAATLAATPAAAAVNLVTNPGFESDLDGYFVRAIGDTRVIDGAFAYRGLSAAALGNAPDYGGLSQRFATVPGQRYEISYALKNEGATPPNRFRAFFTDRQSGARTLLQYLTNAPIFDYTVFSFRTTATGSISTVGFTFDNVEGSYWGLDEVSVTAVPEPATWALMILGFGLVGVAARRWRGVAVAA